MNWGHGITLTFIGFASFIIYMAVRSFGQNIDLVTTDYYREELAYQERIDQIRSVELDDMQISVIVNAGWLELTFPETPEKGEAHLYRPSDSQHDRHFRVKAADKMAFDHSELKAGYYILKVEWQIGGQTYYQEKGIVL